MFKSGFVSIIGIPSVGKSTLMNKLVGTKVAITSAKPQTTRNIIQGIDTGDDYQIVYVDTPGIHQPKHVFGRYMNKIAFMQTHGVDVIMFVVEPTTKMNIMEKQILSNIKDQDAKKFLIINKVDKVKNKEELIEVIKLYQEYVDFDEYIPMSARREKDIKMLQGIIKNNLEEGPRYYEEDFLTDKPVEFIVAEVIREKILQVTFQEVPHGVAVIIDEYRETKDKVVVTASIITERNSQKGILLGKGGSKIKLIGQEAREELERTFGKKFYLDLFIKVKENWTTKEGVVRELGYQEEQ